MYKYLKILILGGALCAPIAIHAQQGEHHDTQERVYQDRAHHDSHTWDSKEEQRYRDYLRGHHMKYREFERLTRRDQEAYWKWRHNH